MALVVGDGDGDGIIIRLSGIRVRNQRGDGALQPNAMRNMRLTKRGKNEQTTLNNNKTHEKKSHLVLFHNAFDGLKPFK